ncbi:MAG: AAA family ATPase [Solirubrobacterales bacterium]
MGIELPRPKIIGLTVADTAPVLHLHVPLQTGLTSIFGKNGVGKTRLLRAIEHTLDGLNGSWTQVFTDLAGNESEVAVARDHLPALDQLMYGHGALHLRCDEFAEEALWNPLAGEDDGLWSASEQADAVRRSLPPEFDGGAAEYLMAEGRLWMPSGTGLVCLADPDPYDGPLNSQWQDAQTAWRMLLEARNVGTYGRHPSSQFLEWDERSGWSVVHRGRRRPHVAGPPNVPDLPPLPETVGIGSWPDWVGAPIAILGTYQGPRIEVVTEANLDVGGATKAALPFNFDWTPSRRVGPQQSTQDAATEVQNSTNQLLGALFDDPPLAQLSISPPEQWFRGEPSIRWAASSDLGRPQVRLDQLGSAHVRYTQFAIQRSLQLRARQLHLSRYSASPTSLIEPSTTILLIDEPERALHPSAERTVAAGLRSFADHVIVATHSTEMIDLADSILRAQAIDGAMTLDPLWIDMRIDKRKAHAAALGLTPSRLAALTKVIVLVEGPHDIAIMNEWLGHELRHAHAEVVPLGGTRGLSHIAEARYLLSANNAPIVVCLDNAGDITPEAFSALRHAVDKDDGRRELNRTRRAWGHSEEGRRLHELVTATFDAGQLDRIHPFGFSERDIAQYLPIEKVARQFPTWDAAFEGFLRNTKRTTAKQGDGVEFKKWINGKGGRYHTEGLQIAAREMAAAWSESGGVEANRPDEFNRLAALILDLAGRSE